MSATVTISGTLPNPALTVPATACAGDQITIGVNYGVGNTYTYTRASTYTNLGGGGAPGGFGETGTISGSGTFTLTATSSPGCSKTVTKTITVSAKPATPAITSAEESICHGETLQMTGSPTGGTWTVSPSSGATVSSTGLFSGISAGVYTVGYKLTNGVCSLTASKIIKVGALPFEILGPSQICTDQTYTYTVNEQAVGNIYTWRRDGNFTSFMGTNGLLTADLLSGPSASPATITLTAQGEFKCMDGTKRSRIVTKEVTYAARPNLLIKCADGNCNSLTVANASGLTLSWYYYNSSGTKVVLGTGTTVTNPKASTTIALEASNGTCPTTFYWSPLAYYPCNVIVNNDQPSNPSQGYGSARMATDVESENSATKGYSLVVRPNPASSVIFFESDGTEGDAKVFDNQGTVLKTIKLAANQKTYSVNIDSFTAGMYYLQVYSAGGKVYSTAIVKE